MNQCKHFWRQTNDARFECAHCSMVVDGAFSVRNATSDDKPVVLMQPVRQCKDCKWFEQSVLDRHGFCELAHKGDEDSAMFTCCEFGGHGYLAVRPTHGCNAWEAKGQKE